MKLKVGIVGLPNVGKSTLFNALLGRQVADASNYPFCTIEPNVGIVPVPDERLAKLAKVAKSRQIIPAVVEFVDIAGLVAGAHQGEGLGNQFLAHIREVNLLIHLTRAFSDNNVARAGSSSPKGDLQTILTELALADLQTLEKQKEPKGKISKGEKIRWETVSRLRNALEQGKLASEVKLSKEEEEVAKTLFLLTAKPAILVFNVDEQAISSPLPKEPRLPNSPAIAISAKIEAEISALAPEERSPFLKELGLEKSGLERLIKLAYQHLGLISFLTAGEKETRAWTVQKGATASQSAGVIHSDFEKSFIKAKICSVDDFVAFGGWRGVAERGRLRLEGRDYLIQDGDVVEFAVNQ